MTALFWMPSRPSAASGNGLAATANGYTLTPNTLPMAGKATPLTFTMQRRQARHQLRSRTDQADAPRLDPRGPHRVPASAPDHELGLDVEYRPRPLTPGRYRIYTHFLPPAGASAGALITSRPITVAGTTALAVGIVGLVRRAAATARRYPCVVGIVFGSMTLLLWGTAVVLVLIGISNLHFA
ncbi:MAG: hypothetical protein M3Y77_20030 [Actinomycetota bacterium]|nr:hypothetical protein [Actinomycetota bacterium]